MAETTFEPFSSTLEDTPHGAVHCAIVTGGCPNGLMGSIPAAALDPIFYAHHTNIDRLYECWLRVNESARLPNDPTQLNTRFSFIDADGSTRQRRVRDMLTTSQLGYTYGGGGGCPAPQVPETLAQTATPPQHAAVSSSSEQILASAGPTRLNPISTIVPLTVSPQAREVLGRQQGARAPGRIYMVIEGLQYDEAPGGMYDVFLQSADARREQIGVINFFNLAPSRSGARARHTPTHRNFRFDATDAVRQLHMSGDVQSSVIFEATTGLTGASAEAMKPEMNAQANVRFQAAQLVSTP